MRLHLFSLPIFIFFITSCAVQTLNSERISEKTPKPQLEEYYDGWLFGFVSKSSIDPRKACQLQTPLATRTYFSPEDLLIGLLTIGIYTPKTSQYWCVNNLVSK